eukprot:GEMP01028901.1.p1 GENE.GEMP01028901.1~~GEMP01028901.1.p1  ORF type:complete len:344 (-),score=40.10 GEMP01028901.1:1128-2159(-)
MDPIPPSILERTESYCTERLVALSAIFLVHAAVVCAIVSHSEDLQVVSNWWTWLPLVILVSFFYLLASCTDPGFVELPVVAETRNLAIGSEEPEKEAPVDLVDVTSDEACDEPGDIETSRQAREDKHGVTARHSRGSEGETSPIFDSTPLEKEQMRWCTFCAIWQPLRAKHCHDCHRCVRTHDHHCIWLGSCVGENNRRWFYLFLVFQMIELCAFFSYGLRSFSVVDIHMTHLFALIVVAIFGILVAPLLSFHTFLIAVNLTTWESAAWQRITYLGGNALAESHGSPFSRGLFLNCVSFFCPQFLEGRLMNGRLLKRTKPIRWEYGHPSWPRGLGCFGNCFPT